MSVMTSFRDISDFCEVFQTESSSLYPAMKKCKSMAKAIKASRAPVWPTPLSFELPNKALADELLECYLHTFETVYRVLHIPTFKRDYEAFWTSQTPSDPAFVVLVKLVLAIGAVTYDTKFSMKPSAIRWVYEAQTWISEPEFKSRLGLQYIQIQILLIFSRELAGAGADTVWVSTGSLVRTAMIMGLHRDPSQMSKHQTFAAEMRRRLWNTILEIALQTALSSGGPPFITLDDFDTEPPGNFDDEQLMVEGSGMEASDSLTQTTISLALRKTFAARLATATFLNSLSSRISYDNMIRIDSELRSAYKTLHVDLKTFKLDLARGKLRFDVRVAEFLMLWCLLSLHAPFFGPALEEISFAFSRKVVIETSLKLWRSSWPSPMPIVDDFARVVFCGSAFYRKVAMQAGILIFIELRAELQDEVSLGPAQVRTDLQPVLEEARDWGWHCIEAGETNVKGYILISAISSLVADLVEGKTPEQAERRMLTAAAAAQERCSQALQERIGQSPFSGVDELSVGSDLGFSDEWGFMMSDNLFDFAAPMPMNWMLSNDVT